MYRRGAVAVTEADIAVVGAGPAGLAAAIEAGRLGAKVVVFDENPRPGGQLVKQIHKFFGSKQHFAGVRGFDIAQRMFSMAVEAGVRLELSSTAFGFFGDRVLGIRSGNDCYAFRPRTVMFATGAAEKATWFPGWTLPGVMTAGAIQTLVNIHRVLPARRAIVVGSGNVGLVVAFQLLQAGIEVPVIVEASPKVGGYAVHSAKVVRHGVRLLTSHVVQRAYGRQRVEGVSLARVDEEGNMIPGTEVDVATDAVCLAVGLSPLTELLWMAGARHMYLPELGGYVPVHDEDMQTTLPGVYVAGDAAGVEEASVAIEEGRLAGLAAAEACGFVSSSAAAAAKDEIRHRLLKLRTGSYGEDRRQAKCRLVGSVQQMKTHPHEWVSRTFGAHSPPQERYTSGPVAVIECTEDIPCDPCEKACPIGAIHIGENVTNRPLLDWQRCTGCGVCISACPGQAIFVLDLSPPGEFGVVYVPYEFLPVPRVGDTVRVLNRDGLVLGVGKIAAVRCYPKADSTTILGVEVPKPLAPAVRAVHVGG